MTVTRRGDEVRADGRDDGRGHPADEAEPPRPVLARRDARAHPGSGLGLALVRATAERHGGRLEIEGARFSIVLPALTATFQATTVELGVTNLKGAEP